MKLNVDLIYPVGAIYMSVSSIEPSTLFGGTWERISGRFLIGVGSPTENTNLNHGSIKDYLSWYFPVNDTGGEYYHGLTVNEMPSHNHNTTPYASTPGGGGVSDVYVSGGVGAPTWYGVSSPTGGNVKHNNIPPYYAVYIWKRTA